jgi:membrane associated rhomboid family serine protease
MYGMIPILDSGSWGAGCIQTAGLPCRQAWALVPGHTIPCVWNLITSSFVETSFISLAFDVAAVTVIVGIVEPVYGSMELLKLMGFVAFVSGVSCFLTLYSLYFAFRHGTDLFTERCGFYGVLGALVVALSQNMPSTLDGISGQMLPGMYLIACCVWSLRAGVLNVLPLAFPGTFAGWWYLRYLSSAPTGVSHT